MGRPRFFRQNVLAQSNSVSQKSIFHWLTKESADRFGMSPEEAELVATKGLFFLSRQMERTTSQIVFPLVSAEYSNYRRKYSELPKKSVLLTPFTPDDLDVYREYGLKAMQNARLIRLIEEASMQGAVFDQPHLALLTNITTKSIRSRLTPLWEKGIRLPLAGQAAKYRQGRVSRSTYALEMSMAGERPGALRKELYISESRWESWQLDFGRVAVLAGQGLDAEQIAQTTGLHLQQVNDYLSLTQRAPRGYLYRLQKTFGLSTHISAEDPSACLLDALQAEHNFSPAKARAFLRLLEKQIEEHSTTRPSGTVVYYAVSGQEPPGKPLNECRLIPVNLAFITRKMRTISIRTALPS